MLDLLSTLRELFRYESWADEQLLAAVGEYEPAWQDSELRERLHHAHIVQRIFLRLLNGQSPDLEELEAPFESLGDFRASVWRYGEEIGTLVGTWDEDELNRELHVPWFHKTRFTVRQVLLQIVMHSQHHRGQNATRLKQLGYSPPTFDYIVWIAREKRDAHS